jgi:hypothetical protein
MTSDNFDYDEWEDRINAYLTDKMTDADRIEFEQNMSINNDLKEAVAFDKAVKKRATEYHLFEHIKPQLDDFVKEKTQPDDDKIEENKQSPQSKYPLSIKQFLGSLGLILLIVIGYWAFNNYQKSENHKYIMTKWLNNEPLAYNNTNLQQFQVGADSLAIIAYTAKQFAEAEQFFMQNDTKQSNDFGPRGLYRAINALMIKPPKTDLAIGILEARYDNKNTFRYDAIEWYLAMAYLQKEDYKKAKNILENMGKQSKYASQAVELLRFLNEKQF